MTIQKAKAYAEKLQNSSVYLGIGKLPDSVIGGKSPNALANDLNSAIMFKKVIPSQISLAINKNLWVSGVVYEQWNGADEQLFSKQFFVMNSEGHIYKCLSNSNGSESIVEPVSTTVERFETSDGYIWKYIASVPEPVLIQHRSSGVIPIKNVISAETGYEIQYASQNTAIGGTIDRIDVAQGGKKYSDGTKIFVVGDGSGAIVEPVIHPIKGEITSVKILNNGSGYTYADVFIEDTAAINGSGALLVPIVSPVDGHGSNPIEELNAKSVVVVSGLMGDEGSTIQSDFIFNNAFIVSDLKSEVKTSIDVLPNPGLVSLDVRLPFVFSLRSYFQNMTSMNVKTSNGLTLTILNDPANPYGTSSDFFEENGIVVTVVNGTGHDTIKISFRDYPESMELMVELMNGESTIFGSIEDGLSDSTFSYDFRNATNTDNDFGDFIPKNVVVDDANYDFTIPMTVSDVSGDFEYGETLIFENGGKCTFCYSVVEDETIFKITDPKNISKGVVVGEKSGASALVSSIGVRPFKAHATKESGMAVSEPVNYLTSGGITIRLKVDM